MLSNNVCPSLDTLIILFLSFRLFSKSNALLYISISLSKYSDLCFNNSSIFVL